MVRERVGDWRSAWRFALAGFLVVATSQTAVVAPLFFALQDQLFPAPAPSSEVTLVALDSTAARPFGPYPWGNDRHAKVINYLASLHPSPWVQFPTAAAMTSYAEYRRQKAQSPVAATTQDGA
jgi:CHASE2 domain-containing sensor protein